MGFFSYWLRGILFLTLLVTFSFAGNALSFDGSVEVITHPGVNSNYLSKNLLRSIFGMRLRTWQDGLPVRVFVLPDDAPLHSTDRKSVV